MATASGSGSGRLGGSLNSSEQWGRLAGGKAAVLSAVGEGDEEVTSETDTSIDEEHALNLSGKLDTLEHQVGAGSDPLAQHLKTQIGELKNKLGKTHHKPSPASTSTPPTTPAARSNPAASGRPSTGAKRRRTRSRPSEAEVDHRALLEHLLEMERQLDLQEAAQQPQQQQPTLQPTVHGHVPSPGGPQFAHPLQQVFSPQPSVHGFPLGQSPGYTPSPRRTARTPNQLPAQGSPRLPSRGSTPSIHPNQHHHHHSPRLPPGEWVNMSQYKRLHEQKLAADEEKDQLAAKLDSFEQQLEALKHQASQPAPPAPPPAGPQPAQHQETQRETVRELDLGFDAPHRTVSRTAQPRDQASPYNTLPAPTDTSQFRPQHRTQHRSQQPTLTAQSLALPSEHGGSLSGSLNNSGHRRAEPGQGVGFRPDETLRQSSLRPDPTLPSAFTPPTRTRRQTIGEEQSVESLRLRLQSALNDASLYKERHSDGLIRIRDLEQELGELEAQNRESAGIIRSLTLSLEAAKRQQQQSAPAPQQAVDHNTISLPRQQFEEMFNQHRNQLDDLRAAHKKELEAEKERRVQEVAAMATAVQEMSIRTARQAAPDLSETAERPLLQTAAATAPLQETLSAASTDGEVNAARSFLRGRDLPDTASTELQLKTLWRRIKSLELTNEEKALSERTLQREAQALDDQLKSLQAAARAAPLDVGAGGDKDEIIRRLTARLAVLDDQEGTIRRLRARAALLDDKEQDLQRLRSRLTMAEERGEQDAQRLRGQLDEAQDRLARATGRSARLDVETGGAAVEQARELSRLQAEILKLQSDRSTGAIQLNEDLHRAKGDMQELGFELRDKDKELGRLKDQLQSAEISVTTLTKERDLERSKRTLIENELDGLRVHAADTKASLLKVEVRLQQAERERLEKHHSVGALERAHGRVDAERRELLKTIEHLRDDTASLTVRAREADLAKQEADQLRQSRASLVRNVEGLQSQIMDLQLKIQRLQQTHGEEASRTSKEAEGHIVRLRTVERTANATIGDLERKLEVLRARVEHESQARAAADAKARQLREENERWQAQAEKARATALERQRDKVRAEAALKDKDQELLASQRERAEARGRLNRLATQHKLDQERTKLNQSHLLASMRREPTTPASALSDIERLRAETLGRSDRVYNRRLNALNAEVSRLGKGLRDEHLARDDSLRSSTVSPFKHINGNGSPGRHQTQPLPASPLLQ